MAAPLGLLIPQARAKRNISPPDFTYPQHFVDKSGGIAPRPDANTVRAATQRPTPDDRGVHGATMMKIHASGRIILRAGDSTPFQADFRPAGLRSAEVYGKEGFRVAVEMAVDRSRFPMR